MRTLSRCVSGTAAFHITLKSVLERKTSSKNIFNMPKETVLDVRMPKATLYQCICSVN